MEFEAANAGIFARRICPTTSHSRSAIETWIPEGSSTVDLAGSASHLMGDRRLVRWDRSRRICCDVFDKYNCLRTACVFGDQRKALVLCLSQLIRNSNGNQESRH